MAMQAIVWKCEHCGDLKKTRVIAERHERACIKNPDSQNCIKCTNSYINEEEKRWCKVKDTLCTRAQSADCEYYNYKEDWDSWSEK